MRKWFPTFAAAVIGALALALASPAAAGAAARSCAVEYTVNAQWDGGYTAQVRVRHQGPTLDGWTLRWRYGQKQRITQAWSTTVVSGSGKVRLRDAGYNATVRSGDSIDLGFLGTWSGRNGKPTGVMLNGLKCSVTTTLAQAGASSGASSSTSSSTASTGASNPLTWTKAPQVKASQRFFVDKRSQAYAAYSKASGSTRTQLGKIAKTATSRWIGSWLSGPQARAEVRDYTRRAKQAGRTGVMVIYAIPGRDCGSYSAGGVSTSEYARWIDQVADGIVGRPWVILEPDALAQLGDCSGQGDRVGYLRYAAKKLTQAGARVYLDAGHSNWRSVDDTVARLRKVGFKYAAGFSLNTSNYNSTAAERAYGVAIARKLGGRTFVIDTSRNGRGSNGQWCNPPGRGLGMRPKIAADRTYVDAYLWIKAPGESDGYCNGGPAAGAWWQKGALALARNASW
ncbi:glycoside hydrolase family 6 protein [Demequina gelatinilytica]|uniref:glycoside hydrolase family 6 protein n=1 Tax=Demequina gelatinilytica TaxID=1638980 RepID=UPI000782A1D0|nr:glycoside hydrolase family 6 protein [Demequina gelatinilytica]